MGLLLSCHKRASEQTVSEAPGPSFTLMVSTGGGFTGLTTGYRLYQDGRIDYWQRFPAGRDSVLWSKKVDSAKIVGFRQALEASGALGKSIQHSGNMTTTVTLQLPDTTYAWYWSQEEKTVLSRWVADVHRFCQNITP